MTSSLVSVQSRAPAPAPGETLVRWSHHGAELVGGQSARFVSERVLAEDGPKTWTLEIGAGVSAMIPTAVVGTVSRKARPGLGQAIMLARAYAPEDRKVRLAAVILLWGVIEYFFPYFDVAECDWNAELSKALREAALDRDGYEFHHTLMRMVAALRDAHANVYYKPGLSLPIAWDLVEDRLVITGLPSAGAPGLSVGGVITRIDGVDTPRRLAELQPLVSAATPQWLRFKTLQLLQDVQDNRPIVLEGEDADGLPFKAELAPVSKQEAGRVTPRYSLANLTEIRPGIVYVDLSRLSTNDLNGAIDRLVAAKGLVIDGRGYPTTGTNAFLSHLVDQPVKSHINAFPVVSASDRLATRYDRGPTALPAAGPRVAGRLIMLTGGGSMSWGETCALFFEAARIGKIVGGPTAGTNGIINRFVLPGGYSVVYSGTRVLRVDGSRNQGVGVQPDVRIEATIAGIRAGRDEVLERGAAMAAGMS